MRMSFHESEPCSSCASAKNAAQSLHTEITEFLKPTGKGTDGDKM